MLPTDGQTPSTSAGATGTSSTGIFVVAESLTFPSAASICAAIVSGLKLFSGDAYSAYWVLAVCSVVGGIIMWLGWPKNQGSSKSPKQFKTNSGYFLIGVLNIFLLFVTVMGVLSMSTQQAPTTIQ
ncbi:hypothetical protein SAMN05444745_11170 [Arthrobacter sp. OV608]|nr:hypothetical protein SAMN05444745_11170 [Arthrobacter sp. OV608]